MDKEEYFRQLYALDESSDSEEGTNASREFLRRSRKPPSSSFSSSNVPQPITARRGEQLKVPAKRIPAIYRTTSAPITRTREVQETPNLARQTSLLRFDILNPDITEGSSQIAPLETSFTKPLTEKSTSTPNIGSVVMKNSMGIDSMLKKRKRNESIKLVPEHQRIFSTQTFFYIPPDDVAVIRKTRINRARSFGVTWTKEWIPSITHIVVDKVISYQDVLKFLKENLKIESIPDNIILVNEDYPIDCTQFISLLDPFQPRYEIQGYKPPPALETRQTLSPKSDVSLQVKSKKPDNGGDAPVEETPPRSQHSTELGDALPADVTENSDVGVSIPGITQHADIPENPSQNLSRKGNMPGLLKKGDDLDAMIEAALKLADVPLSDSEDERSSSREAVEESGSSDGERARSQAPRKKRKGGPKGAMNQENFTCMKGGTGVAPKDNPNTPTIKLLQELGEYYDRIRDQWRTRAYRVAVGVLKKQPNKISTYDEAFELNGIGHRIATKIEEIAVTKRLRRLECALLDPNDKALQIFLGIYGVGISQAMKWIQLGHKTLDDLKSKVHLTKNQLIGIEHYNDFNTRIPRAEVTALGEVVKKVAAEIDPQVEAMIGGSYRREAPTSGDIDFLITKPGTVHSNDLMPFLNSLVLQLTNSGFLVAALAVPHSAEGGSKWHGACILPNSPVQPALWRRIDFLLVPENEFGAALIYFTGDDIFNRSLRLLASRKGMRLNQRGLYKDVMRGPGRVKVTEGSLVEGKDEREIFEALGVPWRPPEERICH